MKKISLKVLPEDRVFYLYNNKVEEGTIREITLTKQRDVQSLVVNPLGTFNNEVQRLMKTSNVWLSKEELLNSL